MASPLGIMAAPPSSVPLKRKIAAILAADVAGYSRLMAENEERTLRQLAAAREVFDGLIASAGGRIFNTAGDSVMCEFESVVEALRAAVDIQDSLRARNESTAKGKRLEFRIGLTIGDVVERSGDLLGDAVNIAARLESLAPPGGICVSRSVHEAVANKLSVGFQELGPRQVKNIPQPVHAYLVAPASAALSAPEPLLPRRGEAGGAARARPRSRLAPGLAIAASVLIGVFVGIPALKSVRTKVQTAALPAAAQPERTGSVDRPSIGERPSEPPARAAAPSGSGSGAAAPPPTAVPPPAAAAKPASSPESGPKGARKEARAAEPPRDGLKPETPKPARQLPADPAAAFAALTREGVIPDARSFPELYHNARVLEAKGDRAGALGAYAAAVPLAGEALDPHLRYASLMRAAKGAGAVRQAYAALAKSNPTSSAELVAALSAEGEDRRARLEGFAIEHPEDAAAQYLLAETLAEGREGGPTLTERRLAYDALDRFLEAAAGGELGKRFIDRSVLEGWMENGKRRRAEIESSFGNGPVRPSVSYTRSPAGWIGKLSLPEPALAVSTRLGERGEFVPTGSAPVPDPKTAKATPSLEVELPSGIGRSTLYVTYTDRAGRTAGPFPLPFDPGAATVDAGRAALERYPESWAAFRPDLPDVLSVAGLVTNRCAIRRATIGFGDAPPRLALPLPSCDPTGPATVPSGAGQIKLPDDTDEVQIQLTYADGSESQVKTFRRP